MVQQSALQVSTEAVHRNLCIENLLVGRVLDSLELPIVKSDGTIHIEDKTTTQKKLTDEIDAWKLIRHIKNILRSKIDLSDD